MDLFPFFALTHGITGFCKLDLRQRSTFINATQ